VTAARGFELVVRGGPGHGGVHRVPGDKSISHRALLLAALTPGVTEIRGLNRGHAVSVLLDPLRALGATIEDVDASTLRVGCWDEGPRAAAVPELHVGPSSAAARLLVGMLVGAGRSAVVDGDETLRRRPMDWIVDPLRALGAHLEYLGREGGLPLRVHPAPLSPGAVTLRVGSAQCHSAVMLAAAVAGVRVQITQPVHSRDHTRRALAFAGVELAERGLELTVQGGALGAVPRIDIPGDPSLAAYPVVAHLLAGRGELRVEGVCLNPTRTGIFDLLRDAGADIRFEQVGDRYGEPVGELVVRAGLEGVRPLVVNDRFRFHAMIDEVPLACAVAARIAGVSAVHGAEELRFKETDRLQTTRDMLHAFGAQASLDGASIYVTGGAPLRAGRVPSFDDHRICMAAATLAVSLDGETRIEDGRCYETSFPEFPRQLRELGHDVES
jgi:3-phosphoshikimate 1-carboxyvinyltransferase